ncbi:MAG: hypothetical protein NTX56_19360 [Proteobacteria bacterium]|nr:hypothetical protein [Pseudomonadota bacterium]
MMQTHKAAAIASSVALAIDAGMLAHVWYVRQQIFPDFVFIFLKKIGGHHVFTN